MDVFTRLADGVAYRLMGLTDGTRLGETVHFFIEDTTKIFFLLAVMIFVIGFLRAGVDAEKARAWLQGKNRFVGYVLASILGAVTPFCSCSSIPLFLGFTAARIPVGITMAFLITSPCVNEAAVVLFGGDLGWGAASVYVGLGLLTGVLGGLFFDTIRAERYLSPRCVTTSCSCSCGGRRQERMTLATASALPCVRRERFSRASGSGWLRALRSVRDFTDSCQRVSLPRTLAEASGGAFRSRL